MRTAIWSGHLLFETFLEHYILSRNKLRSKELELFEMDRDELKLLKQAKANGSTAAGGLQAGAYGVGRKNWGGDWKGSGGWDPKSGNGGWDGNSENGGWAGSGDWNGGRGGWGAREKQQKKARKHAGGTSRSAGVRKSDGKHPREVGKVARELFSEDETISRALAGWLRYGIFDKYPTLKSRCGPSVGNKITIIGSRQREPLTREKKLPRVVNV